MSGIIGIIRTAGVDRTLLKRLTDALSFRGPDGRAVWCGGGAGFGRAWFDTAREAAGREPPFTLDGRTHIIADARIDGRADVLHKLHANGVVCEDAATDAELLLHAYQVWGEGCVAHLLGDFTFAIWDAQRQQLFAARDHFGVKPFFYAETQGGMLFGNTLDCLRRHPDVSCQLNEGAIGDLLLFGFNHEPTTTTYADVMRLPAAHTLTWSSGRLRTQRYWSLPTDGSIRYRDERDYVEHFRDLLRTAVADRLPAENVAVNMSGGLDSTALTALAKEVLAGQRRAGAAHAFTVVYDRLIPDEERRYATLAGEGLGVPIHFLAADDYLPFQDMATGVRRFPEPTDDPFTAVTNDVLRRITAYARVTLSGDGGDALLYASPAYLMDLLRRIRWGRWLAEVTRYVRSQRRLPPLGLRSWLKRLVGIRAPTAPFPVWLNPDFVDRFQLRERWAEVTRPTVAAHPTHAEAVQLLGRSYWPHLFEGGNPGTTAVPVEIRYPFFDLRLVNFVLAIPPLPWCADKMILRAALRGPLPDAVRLRPKLPLNGDPLDALRRLGSMRWSDRVADDRRLGRYVCFDRIRESADSGSLFTRPVCLLHWLDHHRPHATALEWETLHERARRPDAEATLPVAQTAGVRDRP